MEMYFDYGGTLAVTAKEVDEMLVEIIRKDGQIDNVGGEKRIVELTAEYMEKFGGKGGLNEHGRPFLFDELAKDCDNPESIIDRIKSQEHEYIKFAQPDTLEALSRIGGGGLKFAVITNASYSNITTGFMLESGLSKFFPILYHSSGEWINTGDTYKLKDKWKSRVLCGEGLMKDDGSLYEFLIDTGKISENSFMVGDNPVTDGLMAEREQLLPIIYFGGRPEKKDEIITEANQSNLPVIGDLKELKLLKRILTSQNLGRIQMYHKKWGEEARVYNSVRPYDPY